MHHMVTEMTQAIISRHEEVFRKVLLAAPSYGGLMTVKNMHLRVPREGKQGVCLAMIKSKPQIQ